MYKPFAARSAVPIFLAVLIFSAALAGNEQRAALPSNPRALEFDVPEAETSISGYRVELFHSRADTSTAQAVNTLEIARASASESGGRVRIEMKGLFANVPDGEYVVTLQTFGPDGASRRSEPAGPFQLSGHFKGESRPAPGTEREPPTSEAGETPPDHERGGRFWGIVGIVMGIAAIILPLILK